MSVPKIVVVGSSNTDMVVKSDRIPVPGETVTGGSFLLAPGGKGANQGVAAARLGARVVLVSCLGQDMFGRQALEQYEKEGIDTTHIASLPDVSSGVALILVDRNGENLISVASGANAQVTPACVDQASESIKSADILVVQLEIPLETVEYATAMAASAGVPVVLDPAPAPEEPLPESLLKNLYCIKPNETEARRLTGIEVTDHATAQAAADVLLDRGVKNVLITLGARGSLAVDTPGKGVLIEPLRVSAIDTTAAGDALSGAIAYGFATGKSFVDAAKFASVAAALSTTRLGAQPSLPSLYDVNQAMASYGNQ